MPASSKVSDSTAKPTFSYSATASSCAARRTRSARCARAATSAKLEHAQGDAAAAPLARDRHATDLGAIRLEQQPQRADHRPRASLERHDVQRILVAVIELLLARNALLLTEDELSQRQSAVDVLGAGGPANRYLAAVHPRRLARARGERRAHRAGAQATQHQQSEQCRQQARHAAESQPGAGPGLRHHPADDRAADRR